MKKSKSKKKHAKKKKPKGRERRLALAPNWVATYTGKPNNIAKRYRATFHVDWECAIAELAEFGVKIDDGYLSGLRQTITDQFQDEKKHIPIGRWEFDEYHGIEAESDENFEYIVGYTSGGAPYGVTWEEMEKLEDFEQNGSVDQGHSGPVDNK